jgi:16S rRNA (uracil1498-N3)-methyltransferase
VHRFFVPSEWIAEGQVTLGEPAAHQVCHVLRMRPGERIILLDNSGWEFETELDTIKPDCARGRVLNKQLTRGEPRTKISLYQSVLKANRLEFVLQKATELGVGEFIPVITARTIVAQVDAVQKKRGRWERIIQEAAEQSGRGRLPFLREPMYFASACACARQSGGLSLLLWEEAQVEADLSLRHMPIKRMSIKHMSIKHMPVRHMPVGHMPVEHNGIRLVNLFIGPEGGFTREEVDQARRHDIPAVTLGSRVLRAETAAIVAVAIVLHEMGELE